MANRRRPLSRGARGDLMGAFYEALTIRDAPGGEDLLTELVRLANRSPERFEQVVGGPRGVHARVERAVERLRAKAPEPREPARLYRLPLPGVRRPKGSA